MKNYQLPKRLLSVACIALFAISSTTVVQSNPRLVAKERTFEPVVKGLDQPWAVAFLTPQEWLVTERTKGTLRLVKNGVVQSEPVQGLPEIWTRGQGGLLDVVTHPDYAKNGWIYISFASPKKAGEPGDGANTEFIRAKLKDNTLTDIQHLFKALPNKTGGVHFGGRIVFDKKGYMYLSLGERGEMDKAQDLTTHQGKIVRLHEDGRVPTDNPFVGKDNAKPEIWSYGQRNPQGLIWNAEKGILWEHEHGPQGGDELNVIEKGKNYGWPLITYGINYNNSVISDKTEMAGMEQPKTYWKPSIAPCGMALVTSKLYPDWKGNLLVGSLKFNHLQRIEVDGEKVVKQETILENIGRVRDIREGLDGYLYVVLEHATQHGGGGQVVRIKP